MAVKVRWDEDAKSIRDGLMKEDHQVFCTLENVMGKEVMGDFKWLPKDAPIIRMPDLVMDMILSPLSIEDRLNCRLVSPRWGFDILPIRKIFKGFSLQNSVSTNPDLFMFSALDLEGGRLISIFNIDINPTNIQGMVDSSFFDNFVSLGLWIMGEEDNNESVINAIMENSHRSVNKLRFGYGGGYELTNDCTVETWNAIKTFVTNNHDHLTNLDINIKLPVEDSINLPSLLGICKSLNTLKLTVWNENLIDGFERLPTSMVDLTLHLKVPLTSPQILGIVPRLSRLTRLELRAKHSHEDEEAEGELDGTTISTLPSLEIMWLILGDHTEEDDEVPCRKAVKLISFLRREFHEDEWIIQFEKKQRKENLKVVKADEIE